MKILASDIIQASEKDTYFENYTTKEFKRKIEEAEKLGATNFRLIRRLDQENNFVGYSFQFFMIESEKDLISKEIKELESKISELKSRL